jgi:hypothetical protein
MSDRRNRSTNRWGCKPIEDVCVQHDQPLICRHGCSEVGRHVCKSKTTGLNIIIDPPKEPIIDGVEQKGG